MTFRSAHEPDGSHRFTMATGSLLGRSTAGEGAVEEIPFSGVGSLFVLKAGDTMTGNLGIGSAVAAWDSGQDVLQLGSRNSVRADDATIAVNSNIYYDGANFRYVATAAAAEYYQNGGGHYWRTAPSGTAGATVTLSQRLQIDNSGNVNFGASNPQAWSTSFVGLSFGGTHDGIMSPTSGSGNLWFFSNSFYNTSSAWKAIGTAPGWRMMLSSVNDGFTIDRAPSVTAGSTQAFVNFITVGNAGQTTLQSASGNANPLTINSDGSTYMGWHRSSARKNYIQCSTSGMFIVQEEYLPTALYTNSTKAMEWGKDGGFQNKAINKVGFVRSTDFYCYNTAANVATQYIHLKTNQTMNDTMWRFEFAGYEYAAAKPISAFVSTYPYSGSSACVSTGSYGSHTCSAYKSSDGYMVLTILVANTYYLGFTLSALQANPPGVAATDIAISASTYSSSATGVY